MLLFKKIGTILSFWIYESDPSSDVNVIGLSIEPVTIILRPTMGLPKVLLHINHIMFMIALNITFSIKINFKC